MAKLICIAVLALTLAIPASASARLQLSKPEARGVITDILDGDTFVQAYPEADWYVRYWIEPARRCKRISARAVECRFSIFSDELADEDTGEPTVDYCDGVIRIRERRDEYVWSDRVTECGSAAA